MRRATAAALLICLIAVAISADDIHRPALRNLRGVVFRAAVERENPNLARIVSQSEMQTTGETQLRKAGLYVGTLSQIRKRPAPPILLNQNAEAWYTPH